MSICPKCKVDLVPRKYERVRVLQCAQCMGMLAPELDAAVIKSRREKTCDELKTEAEHEYVSDTKETIICPRCQFPMVKRPIWSKFTAVQYDLCRRCNHVWLDGGELAVMQLLFECSLRGYDVARFQKRMAELELSPERKAAFEAALANMPAGFPDSEIVLPEDEIVLFLFSILRARAE